MAGNIKGITIDFRGETTKLDKAMRDISNNTKSLNKELKSVDNALKFNPTNVDLWRQKQELLTQKVNETKNKLDVLKQAQAQMTAQGVDKNTAEYRDLERQIIVTENQVKTFSSQLRQVGNYKLTALSEQFKSVGGKIESVGQSMTGLSLAAAGVVAGVGAIAVKAGTAADDLNTLSKVTGIGTDQLQKYGYAADLVDVSTEAIAKAQRKLTKQMYEVGVYAQGPAEEFEWLGVAVTDANGKLRDSEVVFQEVLASLGEMTNETERDAIAQTLMGKSAAELNPLIEDGGETYKRVAETLKQYNLDYIDQNTLDKANQFNDSLDTMKLLGSVTFAQVGSQLAAYLAPALEKVVDLVGRFAEWLGQLSPGTLTVITAIAGLIAVLAPLLIAIGKVATGIGAVIKLVGIIGPAISELSLGPMALIVAAIGAVIAIGVLLYKNWDKIKAVAQAVGAKIKAIWTSVKTSVVNTVTGLKNGVVGIFNTIKNTVVGIWTAIKNTVGGLVGGLRNNIVSVWSNIKTRVVDFAQGLKDRVASIWQSLKENISRGAKQMLDWITWPFRKAWDTIKSVVDWIKGLFPIDLSNFFGDIKLPHFSWDWIDVGGVISIPSIDIDWYKNGGIFSSPTIAGIGEAGAEAVVPLDKFWDKLDNIAASASAPVINIYPGPNQNAREIAKEVERVLVQQQRQKAAAYGII